MLRAVDKEGLAYYDRTTLKVMEESGFSLIDDLVPFYHMLSSLNRYKNLSKQAKIRLGWMDYYYKCENVSLTCRYFGISRKTFYK